MQRQCSGGAEGAEQVKRSIGADIDEHKMQILRFRGVQEEPRYARRCENFSKIARRCEKVHDDSFARKKHANLCDDARNARNPPRNVCAGKQENAKRCETCEFPGNPHCVFLPGMKVLQGGFCAGANVQRS